MTMSKLLKATTIFGTFTRRTESPYSWIVVRECERSSKEYQAHLNATEKPKYPPSGVQARWIKDRGLAVTWHVGSGAAHSAAKKPYVWADSKVLGVFPVDK
jgi:hypothetical protein